MNETREQHVSSQWATFFVAGDMFALPVDDVQEVIMKQPLTPVPLADEHLIGLLNLRGRVMPAIDLRQRLGFTNAKPATSQKFLVLHARGEFVSLVVDDIGDVLELKDEDWRPIPETVTGERRRMLTGIHPIEGQVVLGLESSILFSQNERAHAE